MLSIAIYGITYRYRIIIISNRIIPHCFKVHIVPWPMYWGMYCIMTSLKIASPIFGAGRSGPLWVYKQQRTNATDSTFKRHVSSDTCCFLSRLRWFLIRQSLVQTVFTSRWRRAGRWQSEESEVCPHRRGRRQTDQQKTPGGQKRNSTQVELQWHFHRKHPCKLCSECN